MGAFYRDQSCCGAPARETSGAPGCPYNFDLPRCEDAEPQAPRDLSPGASGSKIPKAAVLTDSQANFLPLVNMHFHLGAEHKSEAYADDALSVAYDSGRRLADNVRPGFMCPNSGLSNAQMEPYTFQYCRGQVEVGMSYEVHYVHSSAGYTPEEIAGGSVDGIDDGLGGAANGRGQLNPMVVVQGQVFHIVQDAENVTDWKNGWTVVDHTDSVMYPGSTTGPSHNNEFCSPYAITWHVDKACHQISPESFDELCKVMKDEWDMEFDLYPHGSRPLVDPQYVCEASYVEALS